MRAWVRQVEEDSRAKNIGPPHLSAWVAFCEGLDLGAAKKGQLTEMICRCKQ